ncbi:MAG: hypothetical protein R2741_06700 [Methanolobus sp.]
MGDTDSRGKAGTADIEKYLNRLPETIRVVNVEENEKYRAQDIDLIWLRKGDSGYHETLIEVKADYQEKTGNYFIETISNDKKDTPGCFMYTEANYVYYYFFNIKELHILPMPSSKEWFIANMDRFKEMRTSTRINGKIAYYTIGRLVPKEEMQKEVDGIQVLTIS